ncbi:50S ribosomal protein L18 [Peribacillus frigoritolerans]|nr:50S ribosomal protein L18 [Peribacillus frigoritolerans]
MITKLDKNATRQKRHARVRAKLSGTEARPRLNVFRSNKHIYAQLIDDAKGVTLASASTLDKEISIEAGSNAEAAQKVGELIAKRAVEKGFKAVVFDRGGYLFHGRVKALADAAREKRLRILMDKEGHNRCVALILIN